MCKYSYRDEIDSRMIKPTSEAILHNSSFNLRSRSEWLHTLQTPSQGTKMHSASSSHFTRNSIIVHSSFHHPPPPHSINKKILCKTIYNMDGTLEQLHSLRTRQVQRQRLSIPLDRLQLSCCFE